MNHLYILKMKTVILFILIYLLHRFGVRRGIPAFSFVLFYGLFRFLVEFVRQPDNHLGSLWGGATMGQVLSLPMILFGLGGLIYVLKRNKP